MALHGIFVDFYGFLYIFMVFHGSSWESQLVIQSILLEQWKLQSIGRSLETTALTRRRNFFCYSCGYDRQVAHGGPRAQKSMLLLYCCILL